jgi:hypothetical protein
MLNPSNLLNEEGIEFTSRVCTEDPFNPAEDAEIKIAGAVIAARAQRRLVLVTKEKSP